MVGVSKARIEVTDLLSECVTEEQLSMFFKPRPSAKLPIAVAYEKLVMFSKLKIGNLLFPDSGSTACTMRPLNETLVGDRKTTFT